MLQKEYQEGVTFFALVGDVTNKPLCIPKGFDICRKYCGDNINKGGKKVLFHRNRVEQAVNY
jgi:hypothetical protein